MAATIKNSLAFSKFPGKGDNRKEEKKFVRKKRNYQVIDRTLC
jgi:hypothetical protein